tara:strand:- start:52 stop:447 length:396 start_codon:yes stop_codon:yes gene_type:complete
MANSRRVEKLSSLLKREISDLLVNGVRDERIHQAMLTITNVEVSGDLQHVKIFISLLGEEQNKAEVLVGLDEAKGFIRAELARRLQMRRSPELVFKIDKGMTKGPSVLDLLNSLELERQSKGNTSQESKID